MNSLHDMGGLMGFGPIDPRNNDGPFHDEWEKRALALTLGVGAAGLWNLDITRHARESLPAAQYVSFTYFEIWIAAMMRLISRYGLVSDEEIEAGRMIEPPRGVKGKLRAGEVAAVIARGGSCRRPSTRQAAFRTGDRVRARNMHPEGHTRLPRYVRGHVGTVERAHGTFVFPDSNAHGRGEDPQWLYSVTFAAGDLWGTDSADRISLDLWEPYLEPA
jgi:nitrile hydratase beta subunit